MKKFTRELDFRDSLRASLTRSEAEVTEIMEAVKASYISTDRDVKVDEGITFLIETMLTEDLREGRALVVVGESGAGKSTILARTFSQHPAFPGYGVPGSGCPLVSLDVPDTCSRTQLGRALLEVLGYPLVADKKEHMTWELVRAKLEMLDVRFLHLDEAHNITGKANVKEAEFIRDKMKSLLNNRRHPVSLIISGTPGVAEFMSVLTENRRRARFVMFDALTSSDGERLLGLVRGLASVANLTVRSEEPEFLAPRLIHAALGQFGTAIELTHDAIRRALKLGSPAVSVSHFADIYAQRTGNAAPANPFVAPKWEQVDCTKVLSKEAKLVASDTPAVPAAVPPKRYKAPALTGRGI